MEFEVTFEKKMTYTTTIEAKSYEDAEELAVKMIDDEEDAIFQASLKREAYLGWDGEAEIEAWEIEEILGDE